MGVVTRVACQLGIGTESPRCWVVKPSSTAAAGVTTKERRCIAGRVREHRQLGRADDLLKPEPS